MNFSLCDEIKLISLVAENPCLYDNRSHEFHNNQCRQSAWWHIAGKLNKKSEFCKIKWNKLRKDYTESIRREKLKIGLPSKWKSKHHDQLSSFYPLNSKYLPQVESIYCTKAPENESDIVKSENAVIELVESDDLNTDAVSKSVVPEEMPENIVTESMVPDRIAETVLSGIIDVSEGGGKQKSSKRGKCGARGSRKRSSKRVKRKVSLDDKIDEDILAEILREEQDLLLEYRKQNYSKNEAKSSRSQAKKRQPHVEQKEKDVDESSGDVDQNSKKNHLSTKQNRLASSQDVNEIKHSNIFNDDVELFCRHIGSVLHSLSPLQKAVAKKDLNSVLSHYEIVAARNGESGPPGQQEDSWNMVTSTHHMEGLSMVASPAPTAITYRSNINPKKLNFSQ